MICVAGDRVFAWRVRDDSSTTIWTPREERDLRFGPGKGNLSRSGNRLVVRGTAQDGTLVAFAYDMAEQKKYPSIDLSHLDGTNSYCTISPTGQYIFCNQVLPDKSNAAYVFTAEGEQVQHWPENHRPGHGDMTIDTDGSDVYVGISKAEPDKSKIIKRRLRDGAVTVLSPAGSAQDVSLRCTNLPGWAFVTYGSSFEAVSARRAWSPFYREVVALRIDGSGEVKRIAQTHSVADGYLSEAHASPSPDGSQVIWSSNWGEQGGAVAAYVAHVSWSPGDLEPGGPE
jgi:hypothetical protein